MLRWWQDEQATNVAYIFENVPPLKNISAKIHENAREVCHHLREPLAIDVAVLGSFAHRLEWKSTNLVHGLGISIALHMVEHPKGRYIDHILEGQCGEAVV